MINSIDYQNLLEGHQGKIAIAVLAAVIFIGVIFGAYCGASDQVNTPKADQHAANANVYHAQSVDAESAANDTGKQIETVEAQRQSVNKDIEVNDARLAESNQTLNKRKAEHNAIKQKVVVVNADNLDARERQLLTDLRELYPNR
jgi:hypothetical protein